MNKKLSKKESLFLIIPEVIGTMAITASGVEYLLYYLTMDNFATNIGWGRWVFNLTLGIIIIDKGIKWVARAIVELVEVTKMKVKE